LKRRKRQCTRKQIRTNLCYPNLNNLKPQTTKCKVPKCPEPTLWEDWSQWGSCLKTCGTSSQFRYRICKEKDECDEAGRAVDMRACKQRDCTSEVTGWSAWSSCTTTCGEGTHNRHRHCLTKETIPCKQELYESRDCPENPPCDCGWCPWEVRISKYTKDCLEEEKIRHRTPSCPAFQAPGKNCSGEADDVVKSPERIGRQAQIKASTALSYYFATPAATNLFKFKCDGGCIKIDSANFQCMAGRTPGYDSAKSMIEAVCGGLQECEFKPDSTFFKVGHLYCTGFRVRVNMRCVGGSANATHVGATG